MLSVILRSFLFSVFAVLISFLARTYLETDLFLSDVGGLSAFLSVFGTLYGILAAFVVFEVWTQYNRISELIDKEAQGLEQLFRLTLYFRDDILVSKMKAAIADYASKVIRGKFQKAGSGQRNIETGLAIRHISEIIRDIEFNDDHDSIVFDQIVRHYGFVTQIRTERNNQSLTRLPNLLKTFIYVASAFALLTFVFMPFASPYYAYLSVLFIAFLQAMIFHIIEDLDNPFVGHWNLTPEPFERALKHIEQDY
ncbi:MAG: hypothetical protein WEC16_02000 [Anaerolineales bacterium]